MFHKGKKGDPVPDVNGWAAVGTGLGVLIVAAFALVLVGGLLFEMVRGIVHLFQQWPAQATLGLVGSVLLLVASYFVGRAFLREVKRRDEARRKRYREMLR